MSHPLPASATCQRPKTARRHVAKSEPPAGHCARYLDLVAAVQGEAANQLPTWSLVSFHLSQAGLCPGLSLSCLVSYEQQLTTQIDRQTVFARASELANFVLTYLTTFLQMRRLVSIIISLSSRVEPCSLVPWLVDFP